MNDTAKISSIISTAVALFILFTVEVKSYEIVYKLRSATVRAVVPDEKGYIGCDWMTLVKYENGETGVIGGDRGEPGEIINVRYRSGSCSRWGVVGVQEHSTCDQPTHATLL